MMNYRLDIAYDGTRYRGWQKLGDSDQTVQGKIETVLSKLFDRPITIDGSGRTDGGVHAKDQVASFKAPVEMSEEEIKSYLYNYLPEDIVVYGVKKVHDRFHARYNAVSKTYEYRISNGMVHDPFQRKYVYHIPGALNIEKMQKAAKYFEGKHDFSAFTTVRSKKKSKVRTINSLEIQRQGQEISIRISGDGFLHNMVRILVGTLIEIGAGNMAPEAVEGIVNSKDRLKAGPTAPAHGLQLLYVEY